MKKNIETKYGKVTLQTAMFDIDGTNLESGVELKIEGELKAELIGTDFSEVEDLTTEEVESLVENNCEYY